MMDLILYQYFPINDYENQVYYSSASARDSAFDSYKGKTFKNLSSCDKTKQTIRLNIDYYHGNMYNYGCIIEKDEKGEEIKRYYIFVDIVEWLSNQTVVLHYTYDYWQTYCYSVKLKNSFVEREHVSDDTFGKHIIDEGLPISDYKVQNYENKQYNKNNVLFCIVLSDNTYVYNDSHQHRKKLYYDNGAGMSMLTVGFDADHFEDAMKTLEHYVSNAKIDSIQGFYYASVGGTKREESVIYDSQSQTVIAEDCYTVLPNTAYNTDAEITRTETPTIDGYLPANNKCYCYPYNFVNVTNYLGSSIKGKFEFANDKNTIRLAVNFPTTEGASPTCYLKNYDGLEDALDYNMASFVNPELPYTTNQYSAYMSANVNSINNTKNYIEKDYQWQALNASVGMATGVVAGVATGGVGGALAAGSSAVSGGLAIGNANYQKEKALDSINASLADQMNRGDIQHGAFIPSTLTNIDRVGFQLQHLVVSNDCIQTIDHYLSMFGYKVNVIKQPQFSSRKLWNYLKTCGVNIVGNIPQDALDVIKDMFNTGVTIWHSIDGMYNYDFRNNTIVRRDV